MSQGSQRFLKTEVARALRAAKLAGEVVTGVEFKDGTFVLRLRQPGEPANTPNEWDAVS